MFIVIKKWWTDYCRCLQFNRWPVETDEEKIETARKKLLKTLYPDKY